MNQILTQVLETLVGLSITSVGAFASHYLYKKGHKAAAQKIQTDIQNNQVLAENVVRYVQKKFGGESNVVKFDKAIEAFLSDASSYGISINKDAATPYIEAALKKLQDSVANFSEVKPENPVAQ